MNAHEELPVFGHIFDQIDIWATVTKDGNIFSNKTGHKIGTVRDGQLFTLKGEATGLYLSDVAHLVAPDVHQRLHKFFG